MNYLKQILKRLINEFKFLFFSLFNLKILNAGFNNILININEYNKYIVRSLILKTYEKDEISLLIKHFKHNDTLLDFGSGIGLVGMIGAKLSNRNHILVEPNSDIFNVLCSNLKLNNISNVTPLNAVVAINDTQNYYFVKKKKYLESYITTEIPNLVNNDFEIQKMSVLGFNKLITDYNITFISCDIEGFEVVLLSEPSINFDNVKGIVVEMHFNQISVRENYCTMIQNLYNKGFLLHEDSTFDVQYFYKF